MKRTNRLILTLTADTLIDACAYVYAEMKPDMKSVRAAIKAPEYCSLEDICRVMFFDDLRKGKNIEAKKVFIDSFNRRDSIAKMHRSKGEDFDSRKTNIVYALADVIGLFVMHWDTKSQTVKMLRDRIISAEAESIAMIMKADCSRPERFNVSHKEIAACARKILSNKNKLNDLICSSAMFANSLLYEAGYRRIRFETLDFFKEARHLCWDYIGADYFVEDNCSLEEAVESTITSTFEAWFMEHYSAKFAA